MKTLIVLLCLVTLSARAGQPVQKRRGEIEKVGKGFVLTDEKTGQKYNLVAFPPKGAKEFEPALDFYYLELKGRDVACDRPIPCFEVTGYDIAMYDPLEKDPITKGAAQAIQKGGGLREMGGKK